MITEEEAKTKWCPLVRYKFTGTADASSFNRTAFDTTNTRCIGSNCMAWRRAKVWERHNASSVSARDGFGFCGAFGPSSPQPPFEVDPT